MVQAKKIEVLTANIQELRKNNTNTNNNSNNNTNNNTNTNTNTNNNTNSDSKKFIKIHKNL